MPLLQDYNKLYEQNSNIKKIYVNGNVVWPAKMEAGPEYIFTNNSHIETGLFADGQQIDLSLLDIEMKFSLENCIPSNDKKAVFFGFSASTGNWWVNNNIGVCWRLTDAINVYLNGYSDDFLRNLDPTTASTITYTGNTKLFAVDNVSRTYSQSSTIVNTKELWLGNININGTDNTLKCSFNLGRTKIWYNNVLIGDFVPNSETSMINNVTGVTHNLVPNL